MHGQPFPPLCGYRPHRYAGPAPTGEDHGTGTVWLHPDHGRWLRETLATGADPVWCTRWRRLAADWIALRLDLPRLPFIDVDTGGMRLGHQVRLSALYTATGTRPVAALDDDPGGRDDEQAAARIPTLLVPVPGDLGPRQRHVDRVLAWLGDRQA